MHLNSKSMALTLLMSVGLSTIASSISAQDFSDCIQSATIRVPIDSEGKGETTLEERLSFPGDFAHFLVFDKKDVSIVARIVQPQYGTWSLDVNLGEVGENELEDFYSADGVTYREVVSIDDALYQENSIVVSAEWSEEMETTLIIELCGNDR